MKFKVLFVGESKKHNLIKNLNYGGVEPVLWTAQRADQALSIARHESPQLVIVDFDHSELKPLEFLRNLLDRGNLVKVIGISEDFPLSLAVKAVKMGVHEVIDIQEDATKLQTVVSNLTLQWVRLRKGDDRHLQQKEKFDFGNIIGRSSEMSRVLEVVSKIIRRKWVTVLIGGETGTGKELIARAIHYNSFDQFQPFVEINCNALPEHLLESELFGYEKGAFTDARTQKKGLFELAQNGTLFLDEIGEINPAIQVKLLRALEEKKIRRLGGTQDIEINTRIIAATNRDLRTAIREGFFRNDLYYRLNVASIHLPPLRKRGYDVLLIARHFLIHYADEYESPLKEFTTQAEDMLRSYEWPGNVRELKHTIERIVLLGEGEKVTREDLEQAIESETPLVMAETSSLQINIPTQGISLEEGELLFIEAVLEKMKWNKRKTCQILKISRTRLDRKIRKYGLKPRQLN